MKKTVFYVTLCALANTWAEPVRVLEANVNLVEWLGPRASSNEFALAMAAMGVSKGSVAFYVDEGCVVPVAKLETTMASAAALFLSDTNRSGMAMVSPNEFKLVPSKKNDLALQFFDIDDLVIRVVDGAVLLGPASRMELVKQLGAEWEENVLASGFVQLAPLVDPVISMARGFVDAQEEGMGKAIIGGIVESLEGGLRAMKEPPTLSAIIKPDGVARRSMTLALEFPHRETTKEVVAFFENAKEAWKDPAVTAQQLSLVGFTESDYFTEMGVEDASLVFGYAWAAKDDQAMLESVGKPLSSCLSAFMRAGKCPDNPERLTVAPNIGNEKPFNEDRFEKDVRSALFFDHAWSTSVSLELDWFDPPNADLIKTTVSDVSVVTADGEDIANKEQPGSFQVSADKKTARVSLRIQKDKPAVENASFVLNFEVPTEVEVMELSEEHPLVELDDGGVRLLVFSNSVVQLRSKNMSLRDAKVYAFNSDGDCLAFSGSSRTDSNYRGEFHGRPEQVMIAFPKNTATLSIDFNNLPVANEDKLKMPSVPTNSIVTRYSLEPEKEFVEPDVAALAAIPVTLTTTGGWRKNECQLRYAAPENVKVDNFAWNSYLTGVDEPVHQGQDSGWSRSNGAYCWTLSDTNALRRASAIFGELVGRYRAGIETRGVDVTTNAVALLQGSDLPKASVEHNVVWIERDRNAEVLSVKAFDESGRSLKKDNRQSFSNSRRGFFFWGEPKRVEVTWSKGEVPVRVPFAIELKEGGLAAVENARPKAEAFEALLTEFSELKKKSRSYGNLFAANYYKKDHRGNPEAIIPVEVAQADLGGAKVFDYEAKPYNGYFLKSIPSVRDASRELKSRTYEWSRGAFEAPIYSGMLLALPVNKQDPAILLKPGGNDAFVKYEDCSAVKVITSDERQLIADGWIKVK